MESEGDGLDPGDDDCGVTEHLQLEDRPRLPRLLGESLARLRESGGRDVTEQRQPKPGMR